ncbi:MAG: GSU2203 family decaheme c-type cytochrome [Desulfuromonas sp.]|nr:GSU2203 family decaheme c-type cytochrome [Desulfuromonas sp.]
MRRKFNTKASWLVKALPLLLVLGACATGTIREKVLTLPVIEGATYVGQETCLECHDDMAGDNFAKSTGGEGFAKTIHGRLADWEYMGAEKGCESCHGPGSQHVDNDGDPCFILRPAEMNADDSSAICEKCHTDGKLMDYNHSAHLLSDVGCLDCHSVHMAEAKNSLKAEDPELCFTCHKEEQAKTHFPSSHPLEAGKMNCSSCHNAHGATGESLNTDERLNDLCLNCHTRYQGPFVFGHAPVEDDCTICHDPHGSVANNLLVQNEPFLCLQCHEGHFHMLRESNYTATDASDEATIAGQTYADLVNVNGHEGFQMSFGTKCTTCHKVVHGSDYPSQPLTGSGLTR